MDGVETEMRSIINLIRPHQYVKNLFVFAPMLFALRWEKPVVIESLLIFVLFSLLASSVYIMNDINDVEEDRAHPEKRFRPIASGEIGRTKAFSILSVLLGTSLVSGFYMDVYLFVILMSYFLLNVAYSLRLKHIPILDISIISVGFVLRIFAGSVAIDTPPSMWIVLVTFLLSLFLALAKRRDDVLLSIRGKQTRKNIDGYNLEFVNAAMVLMSGVVIMSYILYTISAEVQGRLNTHYLYLTSFFVVIGIMRYMQITFVEENSGSPTKIVLKDRFLQITIVLWLIAFMIIVKY